MYNNIFGLSPNPYPFFWSRALAFKLGYLVDLRQEHGPLIDSLGFKPPMAMTVTAFRRYVELNSTARKGGESETGRLRAILRALALAIEKNRKMGRPNSSRQVITFDCVLASARAQRCRLLAVVESGDDGKPVITFKELKFAERESLSETMH